MLSLNPSQLAARLKAPLITGTRIPNTLPTHKACWEAILFPWPLGRSPRSTLLVFPQSLRDTLHTSTYSSKRKNFAIGWATVGCNVSCLFHADMRSAVSLHGLAKHRQVGFYSSLHPLPDTSQTHQNETWVMTGYWPSATVCSLIRAVQLLFKKPRNLWVYVVTRIGRLFPLFLAIPPRPIQLIIVHDSTPPKGEPFEPCPRTLFSSASAMADLEERRQHLCGRNASGS